MMRYNWIWFVLICCVGWSDRSESFHLHLAKYSSNGHVTVSRQLSSGSKHSIKAVKWIRSPHISMEMTRLRVMDNSCHPAMPQREALRAKTVFYNSLTRSKEAFRPLVPNQVSYYSCGPTVYDFAHIGNFRAFLTYDVIKRWLLYLGYEVHHICNLTDVDDKIIAKMQAEGKTLQEITEKYSNAFFADLDALNIIRANKYPKATEYIREIEEMVSKLVTNGYAYKENGSVYFNVSSFSSYGELAQLKHEGEPQRVLASGAGGSGPNDRRGGADKANNRDFALWKASTPQDLDVAWDSVFGRGRPGWHIECSAMCQSLLGDAIDIHSGGVDLMFPHHSNEIAQTEAITGKRFSSFWLHNGFVIINKEKMSKSIGNFRTLRDIVKKSIDARAFRFLVVTSQYRSPLQFTEDSLMAAKNSLKRWDQVMNRLAELLSTSKSTVNSATEQDHLCLREIDQGLQSFESAMADDLNTAKATAALFHLIALGEQLVKKAAQGEPVNEEVVETLIKTLNQVDSVFGVLYDIPETYFTNESNHGGRSVEDCVEVIAGCGCAHSHSDNNDSTSAKYAAAYSLAEQRRKFKTNRQYKEADEIRKKITELGYGVKDGKEGDFQLLQLDR